MFEITERHPLGDADQANSVIAGLHALGARLAMDDAGTGHSNLAYMQTLGVDVIKIDRVFVDMIKPNTAQVPVLDGLIAMARDLGTEIVAEGVETEAQALYLRNRGVDPGAGLPVLARRSRRDRSANWPAGSTVRSASRSARRPRPRASLRPSAAFASLPFRPI